MRPQKTDVSRSQNSNRYRSNSLLSAVSLPVIPFDSHNLYLSTSTELKEEVEIIESTGGWKRHLKIRKTLITHLPFINRMSHQYIHTII